MKYRGENPVYKKFDYGYEGTSASYFGVFVKTIFMLLLTGGIAFYFATYQALNLTLGMMIAGLIVAPIASYIMVVMIHRNAQMAPIYAFVYAIFEGVFLGLFSLIVQNYTEMNVVVYALVGTFGTVTVMAVLYSIGILKVGNRLKSFFMTAIVMLIVITLLYLLFSISGIISLGASWSLYVTIVLFSTVLSIIYLLIDFDQMATMINSGVSKEYEWSLTIGLLVAIVWLYIDLLRLLLIVSGRRR